MKLSDRLFDVKYRKRIFIRFIWLFSWYIVILDKSLIKSNTIFMPDVYTLSISLFCVSLNRQAMKR